MIGYKFDSYADFLQLGLITPSSNVLTLLWIQADYPSYIFELGLLIEQPYKASLLTSKAIHN